MEQGVANIWTKALFLLIFWVNIFDKGMVVVLKFDSRQSDKIKIVSIYVSQFDIIIV